MPDVDVLIAGAGPTGLVLALWLGRSGVRVRIVDKAAEPGTTSRALVVHARTLEFYRQLGIADAVVAAAVRFEALNLWVGGQHVARVDLGPLGAGVTAFPFLLIFPQDEHERLLIDKLRDAGTNVERPCELRGFEDRGDRIMAQLRHGDGSDETCEASFLAGCDGAHSTVRETIGADFPGGTYSHLFYVADVTATGPVMNGELNVALDAADLLAVFPMKGEASVRLVGTIDGRNAEHEQGAPHAQWSDISHDVIDRLRIDVNRVNWFSTYRVHHRVAGHFRFGRAFLLGDAAHIHSPVGGQGMNTGIGDAVNLAWKVACVIRTGASDRLLDTYEPERIAFARRLIASTDRAFQLASSDGPIARFVRLRAIPHLLPALFTHRAVRRFMFRTVSQTAIEYRHSVLSSGAAGNVQAGDRLPWIEAAAPGEDNYAPLSARDWQMHVYGDAKRTVVDACQQRTLALHAFPWRDSMRDAGFERDAVYLIRPDGYVAFAQPRPDVEALLRYLDDWKIAPRH